MTEWCALTPIRTILGVYVCAFSSRRPETITHKTNTNFSNNETKTHTRSEKTQNNLIKCRVWWSADKYTFPILPVRINHLRFLNIKREQYKRTVILQMCIQNKIFSLTISFPEVGKKPSSPSSGMIASRGLTFNIQGEACAQWLSLQTNWIYWDKFTKRDECLRGKKTYFSSMVIWNRRFSPRSLLWKTPKWDA